MTCDDAQEQLIEYAHDELEGGGRQRMGLHLAKCPTCAVEYCRLQADLRGITEAHSEAPRARVFHRLRRRVASELGPPWWARPLRVLAAPVPAYGAVLAGLVPVGLWVASLLAHADAPAGPETSVPRSSTPALTDYDATARPVAHRDVL